MDRISDMGTGTMQMLYGVHPHDPKNSVELDIKMVAILPPNGRLILHL